MYGNCRCTDKSNHLCGWVILLDSAVTKNIISRSWPIKLGLYSIVTHSLLQNYILPDYTYDLISFENDHFNLNFNKIQSDITADQNLNLSDISNILFKLKKYKKSLEIKEEKINTIIYDLNIREIKQHFNTLSKYETDL